MKENYNEQLKELTSRVKDIKQMLSAQRDRIENLYLENKQWAFEAWRERYLNHPLVGVLVRRLIWRFTNSEQTAAGVWREGRIADSDDKPLAWLSDKANVELWHPLFEATDAVLRWRDFLFTNEIQQPFKQAHREIYLVTDAERATRVYSNRFAAHIIKQHQFNALCQTRRWTNKLRLMVDDEYPPAMRRMDAYNLRAEFWIEGAGDDYGTDTTEAGSYLYLTTDQVRFYDLNAIENRACWRRRILRRRKCRQREYRTA